AVAEKAMGKNHPAIADALTGEGRCELDLGRPEAALAPLERALDMRKDDGDTDANLAETRFALARALMATHGDRAPAESLLDQARWAYASYGNKRARDLAEVDSALSHLRVMP